MYHRELEAASSRIHPEREDGGIIQVLHKKIELLDRELKDLEAQQAKNLSMGGFSPAFREACPVRLAPLLCLSLGRSEETLGGAGQ